MKINKNCITIIITIILITIICTIYFFINKNNKIFNKNFNIGNNITNKTIQEVEQYILNISSYEAKAEITINSNKNTNKYVIRQKYVSPNFEEQTIIEPSNIEGLKTIYENGKLTLDNTKLNLKTVYDQYEYVVDNNLWLNSFIKDYKQNKNKNTTEDSENFIMTVDINDTNNREIKSLYINKDNGKPTKMLIQDKNKKNIVYILYSEIKVNELKK